MSVWIEEETWMVGKEDRQGGSHGAVFREPQGVEVETGGLQLGGYGRRTERESPDLLI